MPDKYDDCEQCADLEYDLDEAWQERDELLAEKYSMSAHLDSLEEKLEGSISIETLKDAIRKHQHLSSTAMERGDIERAKIHEAVAYGIASAANIDWSYIP